MQLRDAQPGDRVKVPLNGLGGFGFTYYPQYGSCEVVVLSHNAGWGTYVGWEEGKTPANMPANFRFPISAADQKTHSLNPKFKYGFQIHPSVEIQMVEPIKKMSSAGFWLACIGIGTTLSALSHSIRSGDQKEMEQRETIRG
jgi:hypothetical protein